jgi:hypothetical protein
MATTTDPTWLLCWLLGYAGHEVAAHQFAPAEDLLSFIDAGWLLPVAGPAAVLCEVCDVAHSAQVVNFDGRPQAICMRTGEAFEVAKTAQRYRVEGLAVARSLALALQLEGEVRTVRGITGLWTLGARALGDTRVKFFLTPDFDRLDTATSIVDAAAQQSGAMKSALIVASDRLDHTRLMARRINIIRLRDIAKVGAAGQFLIDEALLLSAVVPEAASARGRGRQARQRRRILPILDELHGEGLAVDKSNKTWRIVAERFKHRYPGVGSPSKSTILYAIDCWLRRSK